MADQATPPDFDPTDQPEQTDAPEARPDPDPARPIDAPWSGAPWANDLDGLEDGLSRQQVHELWQSRVQPYVTQKEQELGELGPIVQALEDEDQSVAAYIALAEAQYGPEVAQHIAQSLQQYIAQEAGQDLEDPDAGEIDWNDPDAYQAWYEQQPPWVQAQEDQRMAAEEDAGYQLDVQQHAPDVIQDGTEHIFARYVVATDGDVEQAKQLYDQEFGPIIAHAKTDPAVAAQYGLEHLHGSQQAPAANGAPNVLGSHAAGGTTAPPTEPHYASLDDAMEDFFQAVRGQPPAGLLPE